MPLRLSTGVYGIYTPLHLHLGLPTLALVSCAHTGATSIAETDGDGFDQGRKSSSADTATSLRGMGLYWMWICERLEWDGMT